MSGPHRDMKPVEIYTGTWAFPDCPGTIFCHARFTSEASANVGKLQYLRTLENAKDESDRNGYYQGFDDGYAEAYWLEGGC